MMEFCDFTHDRQPQAAAVDSGAFDAIKAVKHLERIFLAETYSIVLYFQQRKIPLLPHARCNVPTLRGIAQSVIEKVVDHFPQQKGVTQHPRFADGLEAKIDASRQGTRNPVGHDVAQQGIELDRRQRLFDLLAGLWAVSREVV